MKKKCFSSLWLLFSGLAVSNFSVFAQSPSEQKLVWQDDFGTFTEEGHYWVWDYSDISNPVKIEKTTKDGWTYELPYSIPGAEYQSKVYGEGTYSVAANVTCAWDNAKTGTMWEWQAYTFYGQTTPPKYGKEYAPDHTSSMANAPKGYGAMLFLNCGNEANEVIYQKEIKGLSKGQTTAKCHISTWSVADYPVKIKLRVTDLNSGEIYSSDVVERFATQAKDSIYDVQTAWKEVSVTFELTGNNPRLLLEIISVAGGNASNKDGNDLILDDIQIWADSVPTTKPSNEEEIKTDKNLVWQDDFGTFTEEGHYWVWDYSDINNPVKVEKTTEDGWTYELPYSIPGAEYQSPVYEEGTYCVAANVTRQVASSGTKWEWQSQTFYGKYPSTNSDPRLDFAYVTPNGYAPDHTYNGNAYGAMLFLNCGNEPNEVLYKKEILGLPNEEMTAKCYISNWSSGDYPVKIKLRVTDLNSGEIYSSDVVERFATQAKDSIYDVQTAWKEVSVTFELTGNNPRLLLEIISVAGGNASNKDGNDLILDDIQIWANSSDCNIEVPEDEVLQYSRTAKEEIISTDRFVQFVDPNYEIVWYTSEDPSVEPNATGKINMTIDLSKEGTTTYYIAYTDGNCYSNRVKVTIEVLSAPIPVVNDLYVEIGETFDINDAVRADNGYELIWFENYTDTVGKALSTMPNIVDVDTPGTYYYYVAQRSTSAPYGQSDIAKLTITVREKTNVKNVITNDDEIINVYTISGALIKSNVKRSEALNGLANGTYLVGSQKVVVNK